MFSVFINVTVYLYKNFIPLYGRVIFHCMNIQHFVYPLICWWTLFLPFWLLWIILPCTLAYRYLLDLFSILQIYTPRVKLLDHMVIQFSIWKTTKLFSIAAAPFYTAVYKCSNFSASSPILVIFLSKFLSLWPFQ